MRSVRLAGCEFALHGKHAALHGPADWDLAQPFQPPVHNLDPVRSTSIGHHLVANWPAPRDPAAFNRRLRRKPISRAAGMRRATIHADVSARTCSPPDQSSRLSSTDPKESEDEQQCDADADECRIHSPARTRIVCT